jgi:hypothetical protein
VIWSGLGLTTCGLKMNIFPFFSGSHLYPSLLSWMEIGREKSNRLNFEGQGVIFGLQFDKLNLDQTKGV